MILFQFLREIHHARRIKSFPKSLYILGSQTVTILDHRFIKVGIIHNIQCLRYKPTHLIIYVMIDQINDGHTHLDQLLSQKIAEQVQHQSCHILNTHIDISLSNEGVPLLQAHLTVFNWNQSVHINCVN